ncbi:adenosylmethionine--8-amino-7-oxononanoate transaminase [Verrucomicrobia bacterium]|jgi:adenosylmethionine---8-amino-7-oxononanoate aminotransferase|nr:adenosylmethionine--8-amino-7-oxononanoate transaminase [bacterium]MDA7657460.1 adenosylmethionine--8-amino-7-oxononanoate transaminase [Verrucomicrobiota bacterium]MDB4798478.1 adenosylmethionine--8-amino-7-oxononanoate transaminase [Verrucomicrobiota bacterium]
MPRRSENSSSSKDPAQLDQKFIWHPFTQMQDWMKEAPLVIQSGNGAVIKDHKGHAYLDANASIWTNLHGHNHPKINRAIEGQLRKISHSSALGYANEPASYLAAELITETKLNKSGRKSLTNESKNVQFRRQPKLAKVFFSDDGSTAMEVALKLHHQHTRRSRPEIKPRYLSLENSYHGDTVGAMSLSHSPLFHEPFSKIRFPVDRVMAPYCYRCPYNRAKPTRKDARDSRKCQWECIGQIEKKIEKATQQKKPYTAFVLEPLVQGAAGMIPHPIGYLSKAEKLVRQHGLQLIADEVLTGFGRTGSMIASHQEGVQPDFLSLAKGLTGGYLPMAATLTTQSVFDSFLGPYESFKTFFHGHSFTGNQLGSAAALKNLEILRSSQSIQRRQKLADWFNGALEALWKIPQVGDIRQIGLIAGIELVKDWSTRDAFPLKRQAGIRVCRAMEKRGVLTRPVGNVIVIVLIYTMTRKQVVAITKALAESIHEVLSES